MVEHGGTKGVATVPIDFGLLIHVKSWPKIANLQWFNKRCKSKLGIHQVHLYTLTFEGGHNNTVILP